MMLLEHGVRGQARRARSHAAQRVIHHQPHSGTLLHGFQTRQVAGIVLPRDSRRVHGEAEPCNGR